MKVYIISDPYMVLAVYGSLDKAQKHLDQLAHVQHLRMETHELEDSEEE